MVYRPVFAELFGVCLSPGYVASYGESARKAFGADAQVAIGNISAPGRLVPPGYDNPTDVTLDIAAARSVGIESVSLFSLDGMVRAGGAQRWLEAATAPTRRLPQYDPVTGAIRWILNLLDRLADQ
jgi:hypothetical protein